MAALRVLSQIPMEPSIRAWWQMMGDDGTKMSKRFEACI